MFSKYSRMPRTHQVRRFLSVRGNAVIHVHIVKGHPLHLLDEHIYHLAPGSFGASMFCSQQVLICQCSAVNGSHSLLREALTLSVSHALTESTWLK